MPNTPEAYTHRIGRTGRAGKTGESVTLVAPGDDKAIDAVLKLIKVEIPELELSLPEEQSEKPKRKRAPRNSRETEADSSTTAPESTEEAAAKPAAKSAEKPAADDNRRNRGSRRRGRNDDLGPAVVGFGDHVPEFMRLPGS